MSILQNLHLTPMFLRLAAVADADRQNPACKLRLFSQFSPKPQIISLILNLCNRLLRRTVYFQFQNNPVCIFALGIKYKICKSFSCPVFRSTRYLLRAER